MPKQTRGDHFIDAILRMGYVRVQNPRSHYREFIPGQDVQGFLSKTRTSGPGPSAPHRILVGPRAIRYTLGTVAQSRPVPTQYVERVLNPPAPACRLAVDNGVTQ